MTPAEVLRLSRKRSKPSLKIRGLLGTWHHTTIPVKKPDEDVFEDGLGFDGSVFEVGSRSMKATC